MSNQLNARMCIESMYLHFISSVFWFPHVPVLSENVNVYLEQCSYFVFQVKMKNRQHQTGHLCRQWGPAFSTSGKGPAKMEQVVKHPKESSNPRKLRSASRGSAGKLSLEPGLKRLEVQKLRGPSPSPFMAKGARPKTSIPGVEHGSGSSCLDTGGSQTRWAFFQADFMLQPLDISRPTERTMNWPSRKWLDAPLDSQK